MPYANMFISEEQIKRKMALRGKVTHVKIYERGLSAFEVELGTAKDAPKKTKIKNS